MPVKSQAQLKYMAIHHPEILKRWNSEGELYEEGKGYADLPKKAFELIESSNPQTYSTKKTKVEVAYRKGTPSQSCQMCKNFASANSCNEVEGSISLNGRCDLFEGNDEKLASAVRYYRRMQGMEIKKAKDSSGDNYMAQLLDKTLEENKALRESQVRGEYEQGQGEGYNQAQETEEQISEGQSPEVPDQREINQGHPLHDDGTMQYGTDSSQYPEQSGQPKQPEQEGLLPGPEEMDQGENGMKDIGYGMQAPPAIPQVESSEIMKLQMRLDEAERAIRDTERENTKLRDENRALGLIVEDSNSITGNAKTLYDKAGTNINGLQNIPNESSPKNKIAKDDIMMLMGRAASSLNK